MLYLIPIFVGIGVNEYKEYVRVPIEFTVLFLCAVGFYVYVSTAADVGKTEPRKQVQIERGRRNELEASVENGVKNGYKFYANNDKVELSDVDLSEYSIKIDAEKKKIILSRRWFYMIKHLVQIYTYAGLSAICKSDSFYSCMDDFGYCS